MEKKNIEKQITIAKLISKSLHKSLTDQEQKKINFWLNEDEHNNKLYSRLVREKSFPDYIDQIDNINLTDAKSNILKQVKKRRVYRMIKNSLKYAAVLFLIICSTYFLIPSPGSDSSSELEIKKEVITLQMDNGDVKTIDINKNSKIIDKKGRAIGVQSGSKLVYDKNISTDKIVYNTLKIPYGKKFQLELTDGTLVYLNSGSTLRYPINFISGQERNVYITGEAYFEVFEDQSRPFIVNTNEINIRVLGTKFNVCAYDEDKLVNTVLVSGSVRLFETKEEYSNDKSTKLKPGHLASWNKKEVQFSLNEVDTRIYIAWTKGKLVFKNTAFRTIRKKLERHYNVAIINHNKKLDEKTYNATFDIETIEQVMNSFSENYSIEYSIVDNKIIIN